MKFITTPAATATTTTAPATCRLRSVHPGTIPCKSPARCITTPASCDLPRHRTIPVMFPPSQGKRIVPAGTADHRPRLQPWVAIEIHSVPEGRKNTSIPPTSRYAPCRLPFLSLIFCLLLAFACLSTSCAPWQAAGTTRSGRPWVVQSGGTWHKMKGGIQKARHGDIQLEQVLDEPDGVSGPQGLIDAHQTLGLATLLKQERVSADNNQTKVLLKKEDTAQITATGNAEATVIGAQAASSNQ